jgi:tripartite-type tricarboxylate transporter receptor subunit TctC
VVNALVADDIDLGWGAGIQTPGVRKGQYINLLSGETARLKISPDAPTLGEVGVPYDFGAKFIFVAPGGLSKDARDTITSAIVGIVGDKSTKVNKFVTARYAGPILIHGAALDKFIANGIKSTQKLLAASAK